MAENTKKTSRITKRVSRKIQTKTYENLEVTCEFSEEVEWSDMKERQEKLDRITKLLIVDFDRTLHKVMNELQVHPVRASASKEA
jgi:hypothetical protein|tara:strand:+ start:818 stop:1072 length:255 start_codon:yes stop_codon:yes gene_type:complete